MALPHLPFDKAKRAVYKSDRPHSARMAELVDARDLKSLGLWLYEFDSRSGYQEKIKHLAHYELSAFLLSIFSKIVLFK
jgi:hypothetical protein